MRERQWITMAILAGSALLLTGCASSAYPAFDREPTAADELPSDASFLDDGQFDDFDLDSLRFVADHGDVSLYIVRSLDGTACLYVAAEQDSGIACGGVGTISMQTPAGNFELGPAPIAEKDGWTRLSENVRVLGE